MSGNRLKSLCGRVFSYDEWTGLGLPLFHVVTGQLAEGQVLSLNGEHDHPHLSLFTCDPIPEHAKDPDYIARRRVELVFEAIRQEVFPPMPSRRSALFCSIDMQGAIEWRTLATRHDHPVFRILLRGDSRVVILDYVWYNYAVRVAKGEVAPPYLLGMSTADDELRQVAARYWSGAWSPRENGPLIEALVAHSAVVAERVEP